jgi:glycerol-3-phosphate dehydrogenase subunit B
MLDLLVIGAGWSGLSAALTAAGQGLRVRVIAKGLGSMHWTAGTLDVLGYAPGAPDAPVTDPLDALAGLPDDHPLARVGKADVTAALDNMRAALADAGLTYAGRADGHNLLLPSPVGAARPTLLAPSAQLAGALDRPEPMLIVGFQGMRDFYPRLLADNLCRQGFTARAEQLPLDLITARRDSNTVQLAQAVDAQDVQKRLAAALHRIVRPGERIGLPAILGLHQHAAALRTIQQGAGAPVFEIPTLPPSVPGVRLHRALRGLLEHAGVRVEAGMESAGFHADGDRVAWVETATSARPIKHRARAFLVATGGILGGGITSDHSGRIWEIVFGLPLTIAPDRGQWFRPAFLDEAGQPVFRGGVAVDAAWQPVDAHGQRVFANVWAAGNVLAHADGILERSLEGVALATGIAAARSVVERIGLESETRLKIED